MLKTIAALAAATAMTAAVTAAAPAHADDKPVSIVLVHGAFVDGSGWLKVYDRLTRDGYEVIVVQNSTATLDGDVQTAKDAIARAKHPVVLVGHSYGGMVITEAGVDPKVRALAYVSAYIPVIGETVASLNAKPIPGAEPPPILPPQDGYLSLDIAKFPTSFAADGDPEITHFMAASQVPWGLAAVNTKITVTAWKVKPTFDMITTEDHMIPTPLQREMVARAGAKSVDISSSHAVMLSHPDEVASFIEQIATTVP